MKMEHDSTDDLLEQSRFWFQKVFVPLMVCIGITGNTITVMVLTRRRMRSSTNIYLSALAIADIMYLFLVFVLSFQHYKNIHHRRYELYWRFFGLSHWLCDAASSTSVWLTVSFTIERYIAVCHPMKGKFFCTENRAKTVTVIIYIYCILTTASTTFEHQLTIEPAESCNCPKNLSTSSASNTRSHGKDNSSYGSVFNSSECLTETLKKLMVNCSEDHPHIIYVFPQKILNTGQRSLTDYQNATIIHQKPLENVTETRSLNLDSLENITNSRYGNTTSMNDTIPDCCHIKLINVEKTNLAKNIKYTTFMYWYSALFFGLIPLVMIATFNCFLIRAVYVSQKKRKTMTRSNTQTSQYDNSSVSNENRITIMLISVVVLFIICQTPTASNLIYYSFYPAKTRRQKNIQSILGNAFNSLLTVNASCNFLLYSIMSKKFRTTFKQLFFQRTKKRQDTVQLSSLKSQNSQKFNPYRHGLTRASSEYATTPRNLETTSLTSPPRSKSMITRPLGKARSASKML
ncbi:sex peptide receptor isoform X2 [Anthonomus grandis grandis]|uniref:sex peptide receptor isoform X2 n=1 Tax=Anthonomus grandis grandis TaxID=2921223 RepID=UPI0021650ACC|nr:sex peptide receptor isoform X2 [Anthonomus grandis grandis]